jgi:hypothetical protein
MVSRLRSNWRFRAIKKVVCGRIGGGRETCRCQRHWQLLQKAKGIYGLAPHTAIETASA